MKKIKLLPSIIMLVLCLAVLGIGVYSATTGSNTISGTLTVNAAGHEVDIKVYQFTGIANDPNDDADERIDHSLATASQMYGHLLGSSTGSRASSTITGINLAFNSATANTFDDVDMIDLVISVTNKSSSDIGVYFWDGVGTKPEQVTDEFIDDGHVVWGHQDMYANDDVGNPKTKIVDAEYSFYHHIPHYVASSTANSNYGDYNDVSSTRYYTEFLHVYLRLEEAGFITSTKNINLNINLNVEGYNSEIIGSLSDYAVVPYGTTTIDSGIYGRTCSLPTGLTDTSVECIEGLESIILPSTVTSTWGIYWSSCHLKSIVFPNAVITVEAQYCDTLEWVYLPASCTSIVDSELGVGGFQYCSSLTRIVGLDHVTSIGAAAFFSCTSLASVSLPLATTIGDSAFSSCTSLASVSLPLATTIGESAFSGCTNLVDVRMPLVRTIGVLAFYSCTALTSIFIPSTCSVIQTLGGDDGPFSGCSPSLVINCQAASKPANWDDGWNKGAGGGALTTNWGVSAYECKFLKAYFDYIKKMQYDFVLLHFFIYKLINICKINKYLLKYDYGKNTNCNNP